jgi:hypothetical protein
MTTGITDVEWLDAKVCELSEENARLKQEIVDLKHLLGGVSTPDPSGDEGLVQAPRLT